MSACDDRLDGIPQTSPRDSGASLLTRAFWHLRDTFEAISYRPGGYHPVELGDKFHNRYVVEHKLGHGGFSTVWLLRDLQHKHKRLVALKITISDRKSVV